MRRGEGLKRTTWFRSSGKAMVQAATSKLKRGKNTGPKRDVKDLLMDRNGAHCEVGIKCLGRAFGKLESAHREGKKSGGTKKPWSNLASNLLWACPPCHYEIDQKSPADAERHGFKIREGVARPWEIPVKHYEYGWVLLDDQGGHRPAPEVSWDRSRSAQLLPVILLAEVHLWVDWDTFDEAINRFGHQDCGAHEPNGCEGVYVCPCGSEVFVIEVTQ